MSEGTEQGFLGEEFLTWLWYRLETEGGDFELKMAAPEARHIAVSLDDLLAFAPDEYDETEQTLRKGLPTRTAEARTALRSGRRLRKAKLVIAEGEQQWSVTIDGPTLNLTGVKLPDDAEDATTPHDQIADRIANYLTIHDIVTALYEVYLALRLDEGYLRGPAEAQAQWMAGA